MKLSDLLTYDQITIQCHDNPDADAIASGYALYVYFMDNGKKTRLIYTGRNMIKKSNLHLMVEELGIPIEFVARDTEIDGLLITVDCQYGAGNVTKLTADAVAVIDHHPTEVKNLKQYRIQSNLGSCATLVWRMLTEVSYPVNKNVSVGTALYYGLFTDTSQFSELSNPVDMDMREAVKVDKRLISRLRNSNISIKELEIAGIALLRYNYNDDYRFAVIKAAPCDPNILGLISDFLLQVAEIDTCVVYNEINDGFKLSVRSCIKEVKANELAAYLTENIGSGGGHYEKAGGFISMGLYEEHYPTLHSEAYVNNKMTEYFDKFKILIAGRMDINTEDMALYRRKPNPICYLRVSDIIKPGARISLRTHDAIEDYELDENAFFAVERNGTVHYMTRIHFEKYFDESGETVPSDYCASEEYEPTIRDWSEDASYKIMEHARMCTPNDRFVVYAEKLDHYIKLFPTWDEDKYILGKPGDYIVASRDDLNNIYVEPGDSFLQLYEAI